MRIKSLKPELVHIEGNTLVPAKAVTYKPTENGGTIETVRPRTHQFENSLKEKLKKSIEGVSIFPTKDPVFLSITYGVHSTKEYRDLDLDNRSKTILDALKEVIYEDDKQVRVLLTDKVFLENQPESYCQFSLKILNKTSEKLLSKHLDRINRYNADH